MAPPDEGDRGGEDLFEDLDKYFAPIEDVDWPEGAEGTEPPEHVTLPESQEEEVVIDLRDPVVESAQPPAAESSLGQIAAGSSGSADVLALAASGEGGDAGGSGSGGREQPTTEMSGEDWRRLREVLGDDEDEAPAAPPPAPAAPESNDVVLGEPPDESDAFPVEEMEADARAAWGPGDEPVAEDAALEPADEPPGDLTLEDLKKPPREYVDLPPAPEAEDVVIVTGAVEAGSDAPHPSEVEAAADRMAESIRQTGEHAVTRADEPVAPAGEEAAETDLLWDDPAADEPDVRPIMDDDATPAGEEADPLGIGAVGGPSWEEPTSRSVLGDLTPPGLSERNLPAAVITAGVLVLAAIISILISPAAFAVVAGIVILLAQAELYGTMHRRGYQPATALGLVVGAMLLAGAYLRGEQAMLMFIALGAVLSFLWYMAAPPKAREGTLRNIGATLLGLVYVPFLGGYALVLLSQKDMGTGLVLAVLGLTFLYDMSAFAVGSFYGKRPLAPTISPKKSWEGLFGATVVTLLVGAAVLSQIRPIEPSVPTAVGLALIIVIFAPLGDLAESLIKRDLRVKDMSALLPGHGGVLDRIDSALFVLPAAWYFLRLVAS
jgi:phosphatidate cytidylyltransferase